MCHWGEVTLDTVVNQDTPGLCHDELIFRG